MTRTVYAGLSDTGKVRRENEDQWFGDPGLGLFIVSDGVGGALAGEVASKAVVETLPALVKQQARRFTDLDDPGAAEGLRLILTDLSEQIRTRSEGKPGLQGMGATVVLALVRGMQALVAHMGDSRAYRRTHESALSGGGLERLTSDHSVVQLLLDCGEISPEEAEDHPARHQITRFVGMPGEPLPEVRLFSLTAGDTVLLCSDGLTDMVSEEQLAAILQEGSSPAETCRRLVSAANQAGGKDNVTAVVILVAHESSPLAVSS